MAALNFSVVLCKYLVFEVSHCICFNFFASSGVLQGRHFDSVTSIYLWRMCYSYSISTHFYPFYPSMLRISILLLSYFFNTDWKIDSEYLHVFIIASRLRDYKFLCRITPNRWIISCHIVVLWLITQHRFLLFTSSSVVFLVTFGGSITSLISISYICNYFFMLTKHSFIDHISRWIVLILEYFISISSQGIIDMNRNGNFCKGTWILKIIARA